jgi:lipopolysaccharide export LptBFGC system permease protein LptF
MEIGWIMFGFFVFVTLIFVVIALFLPEWVGITGKKAQEYIKEQAGDTPLSNEAEPTESPDRQ